MTTVLFYEKPGCMNNTRQKQLLAASGHRVLAHNLLEEKWTADSLRPYFGDKPVAEWFNKAAPKVKSGEIDPTAYSAEEALALMVAEPILIRRPLMAANSQKMSGFDAETVKAWIGLVEDGKPVRENCPRTDGHTCNGDHH